MKSILAALVTFVLAMPCLAQTEGPKADTTDTNVIATVLGKKITAVDNGRLNGLIFGSLLEQYTKDNEIEPTRAEQDAYVNKIDQVKKQHDIKLAADRIRLLKELKGSSLSS